jgi:hypothetical protein
MVAKFTGLKLEEPVEEPALNCVQVREIGREGNPNYPALTCSPNPSHYPQF